MDRDIFDFDGALRSVLGKGHILRKVVVRYLETVPGAESEIREALENDHLDRVALLAHRLKGSSATVHAPELTRLFLEMEQAAVAEDLGAVRKALDGFGPALTMFRSAWENTSIPE